MAQPEQLVLIDANSFCYRAFYAIRELSTSYGQPTNAVYGFITMLRKLFDRWHPRYMGVCFDVSRKTFRQEKFKEYKGNRKPMPDDLKSQMGLIHEVVDAYRLALIEKEGFEADDCIATLARRAVKRKMKVVIVSTDKDILQLADDSISVFNPYKGEGFLYGPDEVRERFGVDAERIADVLSLMGDDADNIPGVPGIGEKTASSLVRELGGIEDILRDTGKIKQEKIRRSIEEHVERIRLNRELVALDDSMDLDASADDLIVKEPDYQRLSELFRKLEFKSLLKSLPVPAAGPQDAPLSVTTGFTKLFGKNAAVGSFSFLVSADTTTIFCSAKDDAVYSGPLDDPSIVRALGDAASSKVTYDLKHVAIECARRGISLAGTFFDVMLAAYLIDPGKAAYELSDIAVSYAEATLPPGDLPRAAAALGTLHEELASQLEEKKLKKLFCEVEMPLALVLARMERRGISVDVKFLKHLSRDLSLRLGGLVAKIHTEAGSDFNINSPKQLRTILFEQMKLPVLKKTKTGPSTDEEVLTRLADEHEFARMLLEYRQLTKLQSTYIDALPELVDPVTRRIHASFIQTGTQTGRIACEKPNLQNIPIKTELGRTIRKAFVASDAKHTLISCDYSQIELRVLAHLSKDRNLQQAFERGEDIHAATAASIYGIEEKDVLPGMRDAAKRVNFGIIYGITSFGLARDLRISPDAAQQFIDTYLDKYPKVRDYMQEQVAFAEANGYVTTLLGRRRYLPDITSKNISLRQFSQRQAINTPIQGLAADLIKLAMVRLDAVVEERRLPLALLLQVHDELVLEVEKGFLGEGVSLVRETMESVYELAVPIKADVKTGQNWLEMEEVA